MVAYRVVGDVSVECGRLVLADPCHLKEWEPGEFYPEVEEALNSYDEALKLTLGEPGYGQILDESGIVVSVAGGDGYYPVYGYFDEESQCTKLEVVLTAAARRYVWERESYQDIPDLDT